MTEAEEFHAKMIYSAAVVDPAPAVALATHEIRFRVESCAVSQPSPRDGRGPMLTLTYEDGSEAYLEVTGLQPTQQPPG